jgi:hypothetical protein
MLDLVPPEATIEKSEATLGQSDSAGSLVGQLGSQVRGHPWPERFRRQPGRAARFTSPRPPLARAIPQVAWSGSLVHKSEATLGRSDSAGSLVGQLGSLVGAALSFPPKWPKRPREGRSRAPLAAVLSAGHCRRKHPADLPSPLPAPRERRMHSGEPSRQPAAPHLHVRAGGRG